MEQRKLNSSGKNRNAGGRNRGAALLLVLIGLTVLTVMILSLLLNINSELHSSKVYASGSSAKLLSQSAVSLVMGEIYQATADSTLCWASQPGMIRTYKSDGTADQYFKLYSDSEMIGSGAFDHTQQGLVPDGTGGTTPWYSQPGVYVDLNQPLSVNGVNQYPILDGDMSSSDLISYTYPSTLPTLMTPAPSGATVKVLGPTWNNNGTITPQVAGFWLNSNTPVDPNSPNQAPMPVKWLYVLRDGKIAVPDSDSGGTTVTFKQSPQAPSASDPIVGRMAFWTDDETGKVNINTASEGSYNSVSASKIATSFTDTPRVCTPFDLDLFEYMPFQNEFQRYPGHPATVSLSTVFGNLAGTAGFPENVYSVTSSTSTTGIAPRTIAGGSTEGTVKYLQTGGTSLPLLGNRLYATPDELLLQPNRTPTITTIDAAAMKRAQFFITASSRAPDVNLFNLPRVCLWPISGNTPVASYQTPFDQLIAFCTTIAGQPYYFQRKDWTSQNEWNSSGTGSIPRNNVLINYLEYLCGQPIPGFGQGASGPTFVTKYNATNGNNGTELEQIFMEIFDYIRSINIYDASLTTGDQFNPNVQSKGQYGVGEVVPSYDSAHDLKGFGRYPILSKAGILFVANADTAHPQQIAPYTNPTTHAISTTGPALLPGTSTRVQAALLFQLFDPSQGYVALVPDCTIKVVSSSLKWNVSQTGQTTSASALMFPNATGATYLTANTASQATAWSGDIGILPMINAYYQGNLASLVPTTYNQTSTAAVPFPDFKLSTSIIFSGSVEVQVVTNTVPPKTVQDITFTFPAASIPLPTFTGASNTFASGGVNYMEEFSNLTTVYNGTSTQAGMLGRFAANTISTYGTEPNMYRCFITSNDVMQDVHSASGDLRLLAGHAVVPPAYGYNPPLLGTFSNYGTQAFSHTFIDGNGMPYYGATRGQLVNGVTSYWSSYKNSNVLSTSYTSGNDTTGSVDGYYMAKEGIANATINLIQTCEPEGFGTSNPGPGLTKGVTSGSSSLQGDFDNGAGCVRDGPYINKADEGGLPTGSGSNYMPYFMDSGLSYTATGVPYFSPAREMPSAVMLGSLSTGVIGDKSWQTLLFHPDPTGTHAGAQAPMDHLLLDLFTMPVVEPYAISEPLSTAGRINMNYLMVPFTYINRDTGLRAVLESQQMLAIPNGDSGAGSTSTALAYKQMFNYNSHNPVPTFTGANSPQNLRYSINLDETLKGFAQRFFPKAFSLASAPDIFRSPSEICTLDLVPNDTSDSNAKFGSMATYWQNHALTGDNSRERPYANIYPLLTTKSNTFTVHFRVQTLQPAQGSGADPTIWREGTDVVTSEYRGSQTIERYVDPGAALPDYAGSSNPTAQTPLSSFYRFRVVSTKQFSP